MHRIINKIPGSGNVGDTLDVVVDGAMIGTAKIIMVLGEQVKFQIEVEDPKIAVKLSFPNKPLIKDGKLIC